MTALIFNEGDKPVSLEADFEHETLWATQKQIAELFDVQVPAISKHIKSILNDGELEPKAVISKMETTASDGKIYKTDVYNLDMIISIGYRVNSQKATLFRRWATRVLKEFVAKGFAIDGNRFAAGQLGAFEELVKRVREIRTSEKHFYRKITDIFATSSDYQAGDKKAQTFFATIQNKFHYATHGHTAAELIAARADSGKVNMGMTACGVNKITQAEAKVAKNYLTELEAKKLELLSEQFLSFAELRYIDKNPMTMEDWSRKLNQFLTLNDKEILDNKGSISHADMLSHINKELKKYKQRPILN